MKTLTKEEFEIYCLLFAANSDFNITRNELIEIGAEVEPTTFMKVYEHFQMDNDMQRTETIMQHKKLYIANDAEKQALIDEMKKVFFSDGKFDATERSVFSILRKLL